MANFEKISKYIDEDFDLPERKTSDSAGYDLAAAETVIVPSYQRLMYELTHEFPEIAESPEPVSLELLSKITKVENRRPTLVPTKLKCKLDPGTCLQLYVRSSTPLKNWLILANSVGIIDRDYYNSAESEGHIYLQMINLSPFDIIIHKGEFIAQGIIANFGVTEDDAAAGKRIGGFGSTDQ